MMIAAVPTAPQVCDPAPGVLLVALMNDYEVVVRGLAHMLLPYADRIRVVELDVHIVPGQQVDITLYDAFALPQAKSEEFNTVVTDPLAGRVVVYSWNTHPELVSASLGKGVAGYLTKTLGAGALVAALERVHAGECVVITGDPHAHCDQSTELNDGGALGSWPGREEGLSARESEVLTLITQGLTNAQIANHCYLSANTVKTYIRNAYRKVGVDTRSRAVIWGATHGMEPDRMRVTGLSRL